MKINETWSIESGQYSFVVVERRPGFNRKTQEEIVSEVRTYHPTLKQCADKIIRSETLQACDIEMLEQAVSQVEGAATRLAEALQEGVEV